MVFIFNNNKSDNIEYMSRLVNWEWDKDVKSVKSDDIEDLFILSNKKLCPPIESIEIFTRDDLLKLSIESDLQASKDAFDFAKN